MISVNGIDVADVRSSIAEIEINKVQTESGIVLWTRNKVVADFVEVFVDNDGFFSGSYSYDVTYSPADAYPGTECCAAVTISGKAGKSINGTQVVAISADDGTNEVYGPSYSSLIDFSTTIYLYRTLSSIQTAPAIVNISVYREQ